MNLPDARDEILREAFRILEREDKYNFKRGQNIEPGLGKLILQSPAGLRFEVVVDDLGNLSTVPAST